MSSGEGRGQGMKKALYGASEDKEVSLQGREAISKGGLTAAS